MQKEKALTKSPIEDKPLRYPAQSLDEKIDKLIDEKIIAYIVTPAIFIAFAINSWIWYFTQSVPNPIYLTIVAICAMTWGVYKIFHFKKELKFLRW